MTYDMWSRLSETLLLAIFRRWPPRPSVSIFREASGRPEEEYELESKGLPFFAYFKCSPRLFRGKDVLDVGSGFGGRTLKYLEYGARSVTGLEISEDKVRSGSAFAERLGCDERAHFLLGSGEALPLPDCSFDLVTMLDTLEHVVDPAAVLRECQRVLRPGGLLAVVFPPYFNLTGGSHLHGYATRFPGLNLVFSSRTLKRATRRLLEEEGVEYRRFLRELESDKLWNMNGLTVRRFLDLVPSSRLRPVRVVFRAHLEYLSAEQRRNARVPRRIAYAAAQLMAKAPVVREIACMRVCAVLERPGP